MNRTRLGVIIITLALGACDGAPPVDQAAPTQQALTASPPVACVENVLCIRGSHWDPVLCRCVPDACVSQEDGPCGGFTTHPCTCAPGLTCVPNPIPDLPGRCQPARCCPVGWDMYACREKDGGSGLNCHNPQLACPSSPVCGGGCDVEVSRRCPVCDPLVCPAGERWDPARCKCVPPCTTAADCHGALPALCRSCADDTFGCAHWACVANACQVAYCQ